MKFEVKHWRNISLKLDRNGKKPAKTLRETSIRRTRSFKAHVSCTPAHTRRKNTTGQQRIKKLAVRLMEFGILNITLFGPMSMVRCNHEDKIIFCNLFCFFSSMK